VAPPRGGVTPARGHGQKSRLRSRPCAKTVFWPNNIQPWSTRPLSCYLSKFHQTFIKLTTKIQSRLYQDGDVEHASLACLSSRVFHCAATERAVTYEGEQRSQRKEACDSAADDGLSTEAEVKADGAPADLAPISTPAPRIQTTLVHPTLLTELTAPTISLAATTVTTPEMRTVAINSSPVQLSH
jgi:hypothetical protein